MKIVYSLLGLLITGSLLSAQQTTTPAEACPTHVPAQKDQTADEKQRVWQSRFTIQLLEKFPAEKVTKNKRELQNVVWEIRRILDPQRKNKTLTGNALHLRDLAAKAYGDLYVDSTIAAHNFMLYAIRRISEHLNSPRRSTERHIREN